MRIRLAAIAACALITGGGAFAFPAVTAAQPTDPDASETGFVDNPHLVDPYPMTIASWNRLDDNTITVHFTSGVPECYGVHANVQESADTVAVELLGGTLPEAQDRACIALAVFGTLDVALQSPLGDRQVLGLQPLPEGPPPGADGPALPTR